MSLVLRNKVLILGIFYDSSIGNPTVGKSSILQMFTGNSFPKTYNMTISPEMTVKVVSIPESNVSVELYLIDTSGNDTFLEYIHKYGMFSSCVLVYDVTNLESFNTINKWIAQMKKLKTTTGASMGVLLANKVDLGNRRVVSTIQGEELAKLNGFGYFEVSALNNTEVDSPFYYLSSVYHDHFEESLKNFTKIASST